MINSIGISEAIQSLRPKTTWVLRGDSLEWNDSTQTEPTAAEITAEITRLESLEPQRLLNIDSLAYLASTDWYVTRFTESGVAVPADVTTARTAARTAIV